MQASAIRRPFIVFWGVVCLAWIGVDSAHAQVFLRPKPTPVWIAEAPRQQIAVGYSYLKISGAQVNNLPIGFLLDSNFFFNRHLGLQIESASHWGSNASIGSVEAGPILRLPMGHFAPFVHANIGYARVSPPGTSKFGWGMSGGGGIDVRLSRIFEVRLFQADYVYNRIALAAPLPHIDQNSIRVSGGAIWNIGTLKPAEGRASFKCYADPGEVYAGEPVHIAGTALDFSAKRKTNYSWSANGGKTVGRFASTSVDTSGLRPGTYVVTGDAADGKASARCSVSFTVRPFPAPIAHCSVNPANMVGGGTATVIVQASSSSNRTLSYSYAASAGSIRGNGAHATLATNGASGPIRITATVTDDQGLSTSCDATVTISVPIVANTPQPRATPVASGQGLTQPAQTSTPTVTTTPATRQWTGSSAVRWPHPNGSPVAAKVSELEFHPGTRPGVESRVDNVAKAILDDVALRMRSDPDIRAVIVGMAATGESSRTAAQRAANVKHYLAQDAGIDSQRIAVRTGNESGMKTEIWIVPAGAVFDQRDTKPVDEQRIKGVSRAQ